MHIVWLALLGLLLSGYFVLAGYDYGTQVLYPFVARGERERRTVRAALGPFFFGNEVWLVAVVGVLFGGFPFVEGELLSGLYPLVVVVLLGLVVGKAAIQLRGRMSSAAGRRLWDALIVLGGVVPAAGWGMVIGVLLRGVPRTPGGAYALRWSTVLEPFVLATGLGGVLLFAAHGAAFLSVRTEGPVAQRVRRLTPVLSAMAAAAVIASTALSQDVSITEPGRARCCAGVLVVALVIAVIASMRGRFTAAFAATIVSVAVPVPLVGVALHPYLLVSAPGQGVTVTEAAADSVTLTALLPVAILIVPTILAYQLWSWRLFRGRITADAPGYF
ncbi:cytochrome d ubiquinol oxidase subunit II [Nocardia yunnanensis]|uniref:cytochrome d ubiquinol oxidase subunit II n=1 Tax=Nocardia yunnanensis TaxID=2382165 RepID=UPI001CA3F468|nr:cytochrome d ubiquinol oxidase subunit II [Nocardia yunnanensis]